MLPPGNKEIADRYRASAAHEGEVHVLSCGPYSLLRAGATSAVTLEALLARLPPRTHVKQQAENEGMVVG